MFIHRKSQILSNRKTGSHGYTLDRLSEPIDIIQEMASGTNGRRFFCVYEKEAPICSKTALTVLEETRGQESLRHNSFANHLFLRPVKGQETI
jgi:hypothetical protein